MTLACAAMGLILAACAAYAASHPLRAAILRARWAWRCRGCPPRNDGDPLDEREQEKLDGILRGWPQTARTERSQA
jgi:hypothetical protein